MWHVMSLKLVYIHSFNLLLLVLSSYRQFHFILKINHHSLSVKEEVDSGILRGSGEKYHDPIPPKIDFLTFLLMSLYPFYPHFHKYLRPLVSKSSDSL